MNVEGRKEGINDRWRGKRMRKEINYHIEIRR
jgi:hypothetical protein